MSIENNKKVEKKKFNKKKIIIILFLFIVAVSAGIFVGVFFVYQRFLPQIENIEDIKPTLMTTIYDDKGLPIKEFAIEKREIARYKDLPKNFINALITSEDNDFFNHWGINFRGIFRAVYGIVSGNYKGGGSSITQQLARGLFLTPERTYKRKFREMLLALQIEKKYSKEQIITFYCNKIFLGGQVYGVKAAAMYYFGKDISDLTLSESALLVAIIPNPNNIYSIFKRPDNCKRRRDFILKKMLRFGYIKGDEYKLAVNESIPLKPYKVNLESTGDFYIEEVRRYLENKYGGDKLYRGGLHVYTGMNTEMQKWAEQSLKEGLRALDKRRGWRKKKFYNVKKDKLDPKTYSLPQWKNDIIAKGNVLEGIVIGVSSKSLDVRIKDYRGVLKAKDAAWSRRRLTSLFKNGDVGLFKINSVDKEKKTLTLSLEQKPLVQGAIMVMDNKTGVVRALVGGYSFADSEWNNATQAYRQTGSTFKPFVYSAALANGYTPATIIDDSPVIFDNQWTQEPYEPQNHGLKFSGPVTLRRALELSINVVSAKIVERVGPPLIVNYARKFGISSRLKPYMSISLGAFEVTLKDMVSAYSAFPNMGVRVKPVFIKEIQNSNRQNIESVAVEKKRVLDKDVAYVMNCMLQGVVKSGTASYRCRNLKGNLGGKTGTSNEYSDAWFIGFSPSITVGVWVGYQDSIKSLGHAETGSKAALPVFVGFMEKYLEHYEQNLEFEKPTGVVSVKIDKKTGKLFGNDCLYPFYETFITGSEPLRICTQEDHDEIVDYYGK